MAEGFLGRLAGALQRGRALVVLSLLGAVAALALHLPSLEADFTPSDLFARFEDQERVAAEFEADFGNTSNVLLVLVRAESPFETSTLQYLHDLSGRLRDRPDLFDSVQGLTITPVPRRLTGADGTFDPARLDPKIMGAVGLNPFVLAMMAAAPTDKGSVNLQRLMVEVGTGRAKVDTLVEGDEVTPEEASHIKEVIEGAKLLRRRLIGQSLRDHGIALVLRRGLSRNDQISATVEDIEGLLAANPPPEGVEVEIAGLPYVRHRVVSRMRSDQTVMLPASIVVCLLIMLLSFRWWPALVLPLGAVIVSAVMLVGGMAFAGEPFNIINNVAPLLIIIIGIADSIHLIHRYGEELAEGHGRDVAVRHTIAAMALACFLTSWTTAVGFFSLAVSRTDILQRFGVTAGLGVMVAFVVTIALLPAGLSVIKAPDPARLTNKEGWVERFIERLTRGLLRRRWWVLGVTALVGAISVWGALTLDVDNAVLDQLDEQDPVYQTTRLLEREFAGVRPLELRLVSQTPGRFEDPAALEAIEGLQRWLEDQPGVLATTSWADFLRELWFVMTGEPSVRTDPFETPKRVRALSGVISRGDKDPMASWVTKGRERTRISVQLEDIGAQATIALTERVRREAAARLDPLGGIEVQLTGDAYIGSQGLDIVIWDLLGSLLTAIGIIFIFLSLLFRSVRLGLLSIPPNVVPLLVTMSYMVVRDIPLNAATVIIFSISVGLAVDGSIHLLARFREELEARGDVEEALVHSARGTGKAIILTCLSLMLGFGVMLFSSFPPVRRFGELIAVTVFGCLLATIVVLPPLLRVGIGAGERR